MTPSPVGTLSASQTITLSPCSAVPFLSHRQTPHPHTASYIHRHPHMHSHTDTHAQSLQEHRHRKHRDPGAVLTHQAHGVCGNSPESQLGSVAGPFTHGEPVGLLETPREQGRQQRGLSLTQLGPDQASLLCKICRYYQWTSHRRGTSVHSQRGYFLVKNTKTAAPQLHTPFPSSRRPLPCCGPRTEGQLLP